ncbi:DUF192 domain-containing protein [Patescibacteria group bacterium]|nr:DUF192 domain-containing protein [Patescibacteria group bacterium]
MDKNIFISLTKYLSIPLILIIILFFITTSNKKVENTNNTYIPITNSAKISYTKAHNERLNEKNAVVKINNFNIFVKIAKTQTEQNIGLMQKRALNINQGMLFIFTTNTIHDFWMAYTKIPLDMVFISQNKKIEQIIKAYPCTGKMCIEYQPVFNSLYVLELSPKAITKFNIKVGDLINF